VGPPTQMSILIDDLINYLEKRFPPELAAEWDSSGWQYRGTNKETVSIVISLDVTKKTVQAAEANGANLILSHHPILFEMPDYIDCQSYPSSTLCEAIRSDISIYSLHTNIDAASGGMNDRFAEMVGLNEAKIPEIKGDNNKEVSFSRLGTITPTSFDKIAQKCIELFNIDSFRVIGNKPEVIRRLLVVSGSGSPIIKKLSPDSFDLAITGDLKYHDSLFFRENGYCVMDIGHFIEKKLFTEIIQDSLEEIYGNRLVCIKTTEENCLRGVNCESNN